MSAEEDRKQEQEDLREIRRLYIQVLRRSLEEGRMPKASTLAVIGRFLEKNEAEPAEEEAEVDPATMLPFGEDGRPNPRFESGAYRRYMGRGK